MFFRKHVLSLHRQKNSNKMDKRLKILTIVFSIVYVAVMGGQLKHAVTDFVYGFKMGYQAGVRLVETGEKLSLAAGGTFFLSLKPETGLRTFPTEMLNQADGSTMKAEIGCMVVELTDTRNKMTVRMFAADGIMMMLGLLGLFLIVFIPIQVFRVVRSITRDKIFDHANIRKLRSIGYAALAYYLASVVVFFLQYRIAASIIHIEGYSLKMDWGNTTLLLMAVVVMMFAELLKISVYLKEEQELTV